ncbi:putative ribosomal protein S18 [Ancylostoma caninum]|uniref:Putative ribosomal protein S18 n=1 Tax=Ancylostoma caninum TaxID=29170 RepID=A0A368H2M0_ANCCA|nr:putative ribosomal protein S18 [Ancylostoma caninum]
MILQVSAALIRLARYEPALQRGAQQRMLSTFLETESSTLKSCDSDPDAPVEIEGNPYKKEDRKCLLCRTGIELDYKNARLLQQFVSTFSGRVYDRHITGLCDHQQKKLVETIALSRKAGYMPVFVKDPNPENGHGRTYFIELVDKAQSNDDVADLITLFETLNGEELEKALPSLCFLAEKCPSRLKGNFLDLAYCILTDVNCSRSGRKAVLACLRVLTHGDEFIWDSFFTLYQCLEEPQFHIINPVLPRMDDVLTSVHEGLLNFKWAAALFMRALVHSNGWVRLWAIEKLVAVNPAIMATNQDYAALKFFFISHIYAVLIGSKCAHFFQFLLTMIYDHLNSNDPFWRLLERGNLPNFLESLTHLTQGILLSQDEAARRLFIEGLLITLSKMCSPSSLFFLSEALAKIQVFRVLNANDLILMKTLVQKVQYVQHTTMRIVTQFNFVVFFCKMLKPAVECVNEIGFLTAFFSRTFPRLFGQFIDLDPIRELLSTRDEPVDFIRLALSNRRDFEKDDLARLLWVRAGLLGEENQLQKRLELELADRLTAIEDGVDVGLTPDVVEDVDILLCILLESPKDLISLDSSLVQLINGYVLLRIAVASGAHAFMMHNIYTSLIKRLKCPIKPFVDLALSLISEEAIPCDRHCLLAKMLYDLLDELSSEDIAEILPKIISYLGEKPLAPVRLYKKSICSREKDMNKQMSELHEYRLKLVLKFSSHFCEDHESLLSQCVECIDSASAYPVAECYLKISRVVIEKVNCPDLLVSLMKTSVATTNEERKSQNFLPALQHALSLIFTKPVMSHTITRDIVMSFCGELLELARLNTPVALHLSSELKNAAHADLLTSDWATTIFSLAVFGPIPKKENRVVNAAYEMIYTRLPNNNDDIHKPFEVVQRTRLNGICTALLLSQKDSKFANHLVDVIIAEINAMNLSSSRSFGLSLAHRQNTRAVSLLLLLIDYVSDEAVLNKVFTNCMDWIVDPCQQFSIKLILEWLLVRMALRNPVAKEQLLGQERIFASKRIGSVSSWINMIVLMSRAEEDKVNFLKYRAGQERNHFRFVVFSPNRASFVHRDFFVPFNLNCPYHCHFQSLMMQFIELILPWTTAQNFAVRCTAIAGLRLMYKTLASKERERWYLLQRIVEFNSEPAGYVFMF